MTSKNRSRFLGCGGRQRTKRTAGIEGGGRLPDARLFTTRLAADIIRLPGGVRNRSAVQSATAMKSALKVFDDARAGLFRGPDLALFGRAGSRDKKGAGD
jgi:hypothetical protein